MNTLLLAKARHKVWEVGAGHKVALWSRMFDSVVDTQYLYVFNVGVGRELLVYKVIDLFTKVT